MRNRSPQLLHSYSPRPISHIVQLSDAQSLRPSCPMISAANKSTWATQACNTSSYESKALGTKKSSKFTVPFHSFRQSRVTGPSNLPKCHGGNGYFWQVPNSPDSHMPKIVKICGRRLQTAEVFGDCHADFQMCRNQNFDRPVTGNGA